MDEMKKDEEEGDDIDEQSKSSGIGAGDNKVKPSIAGDEEDQEVKENSKKVKKKKR